MSIRIEIFDGAILLGETVVNADGTWSFEIKEENKIWSNLHLPLFFLKKCC